MWGGSLRPLEGPLGEVRVKETEDEEERQKSKRGKIGEGGIREKN